jgi:hypothetical protein
MPSLTPQLYIISPLSWDLRFVCRRFNDILTPLLYRNIKLPSLGNDEYISHQVLAKIRAHARKIVVDQEVNWEEASKLIRECRFLHELE